MRNDYMLRSFFTVVLIALTNVVIAQIPNASFEHWTGGAPDGWYTTNGNITYVTPTADAHDSATAALSQSQELFSGFNIVSPLRTGDANRYYFPCNCQPQALHFWYKTNLQPQESFLATVGGMQGGTQSVGGVANIATSTNVYTEGVADLLYSQLGNMDSMAITFVIVTTNPSGSPDITSSFTVDDLSWGPLSTGVEPITRAAATLEFIGMSDNVAHIVYTLSRRSEVQLNVYDVTGKLVRSVLDLSRAPGRYKAVEDFSALTNGVYFCRLIVDGESFSKAFVVEK